MTESHPEFESAKDAFAVRLSTFEGPLDLLLHLIRRNAVNIYDIPIALITTQYLETIELIQELDLDVAGEFLVMAATLIHIKSRMLLPRCWFDRASCAAGLEALQHYRRDYNTRLNEFKAVPVHDWASHAADAFRYLAVALKEQPAVPVLSSMRQPLASGWMGA